MSSESKKKGIFKRAFYMCPKCSHGEFFNVEEEFSTKCADCGEEMVLINEKYVTFAEEEKRKRDEENFINAVRSNSLYVPKCPTCGSPDIEKISLSSKVVGGALFGLFSSNVRKTMHCKNCGYKWWLRHYSLPKSSV